MRKDLVVGCSLFAVGIVLVIGDQVFAKYEEPNYKVSGQTGNIEVRDYPGVIAAQVTVPGQGEKAANQAFSILAGYIFGKNTSREKIAMTVPVTEKVSSEKIAMTVPVTERSQNGNMTMSFFMPSSYTLDSLPVAKDERITFQQIAPRRFAVIRFSGLASESSIAKHTDELQKYISTNGLNASAEPIRAFYNPPWTLPFMRRNEIWIEIDN